MRGETKKILCLDFDGVVHAYRTGWKGESIIDDEPVPGSLEFMRQALFHFRVLIYSSRSATASGRNAMQRWLEQHCSKAYGDNRWSDAWWLKVEWPEHKPAAFLTIDDRAMLFTGTFPSILELVHFKTWTEK